MANVEVILPSMGEGVMEAEVVKWLKSPGDSVSEGDPILEVSTDKVDTEVVSPVSGIIKESVVSDGDVIEVNQLICYIEDQKGGSTTNGSLNGSKSLPNSSNKKEKTIKVKPQEILANRSENGPGNNSYKPFRSSPVVRKIATENQVDLTNIPGSGINGRITKKDILDYIEKGLNSSISTGSATAAKAINQKPLEGSSLKTQIVDGEEFLEGVKIRREPMSRIRKKISEHMIQSVRTSPHVTTVFEIDLNRVVKLRENLKEAFLQKNGFKLTYTPFFIKAAIEGIKAFPVINSSVDGDQILHKEDINIGCAVATDNGLLVPVIKKSGELNLFGISKRLDELVKKSRTSSLLPEEMKGGTFTITNPGGFGSLTSNPIINQPQVAILGIGNIVKRPVVLDEMIAIRPIMHMSITFDHRVVDGEQGAKFLAVVKDVLENFSDNPM